MSYVEDVKRMVALCKRIIGDRKLIVTRGIVTCRDTIGVGKGDGTKV